MRARHGCAVDKAARGTFYVSNFYPMPVGTVTPIPVCTNVAGKPIPVGNGPATIAITPDGTTAYVVNESSGTVTPIRTAANTPGKAIRVAGRLPELIAMTPNGKTVYVVSFSGVVTPIRVATDTAGPGIPVGGGAFAIAITPNGKTGYVVDKSVNAVTPINTCTNKPGKP
jgi:DNA-binding beta-propeller fold protein YncE